MAKNEITVKDTNGNEVTVSAYVVAKALRGNAGLIAEVIGDVCNSYTSDHDAYEAGKEVTKNHPTLQANAVGFCLKMLEGYAMAVQWVDPRNETAVETARKVAGMMRSGELSRGAYI